MTARKRLDEIGIGERLIVDNIDGKPDMRRRLADLGLVEGTRVDCLMVSPLGDPTAYRIRGAVIALRRADACGIVGRVEEAP